MLTYTKLIFSHVFFQIGQSVFNSLNCFFFFFGGKKGVYLGVGVANGWVGRVLERVLNRHIVNE